MTTPEIITTALFALAILGAGVAGVGLSGYFPLEARPAVLDNGRGRLLISLLIVTSAALAVAAFWVGLRSLPWTAIVIAGGLALLAAPAAFQMAPRRFWDSPRGVGLMIVVTGALLTALLQTGG